MISTLHIDSDPRTPPARRRIWTILTRVLVATVFAQAVFAGVLLSGESWGRTSHRITAMVLIGVTLLAGIVAAVTLRKVAKGRRLAVVLLVLAVVLFLQTAVGMASAEGENLLWLHVPLGVALVGFSAQTLTISRQLGEETT